MNTNNLPPDFEKIFWFKKEKRHELRDKKSIKDLELLLKANWIIK